MIPNRRILIDQSRNKAPAKIKNLADFRRAMGLTVTDMQRMPQSLRVQAQRVCDSGLLDSAGSIFFLRELEYIKREVFDVLYEDLPARDLFPVSNEIGPGRTHFTYRVYDKVGQAKLVANYAKDFPRVDVFGKEVTQAIKTIGDSYGYSYKEIQASQVAGGIPLDQRRAETAFRAIEESVNDFSIYGTSDAAALPGWYNNPYIPRAAASTKLAGGTSWAVATPDEILGDVFGMFTAVNSVTLKIEKADTLVLPVNQYNYVSQTPRSALSDTTILAYIVENCPYLAGLNSVMSVNEATGAVPFLNAAVPGGIVGNTTDDVAWVYTKNPKKLQLQIPVEFMQGNVQQEALDFRIACWLDYCGLIVYYPQAATFIGGI